MPAQAAASGTTRLFEEGEGGILRLRCAPLPGLPVLVFFRGGLGRQDASPPFPLLTTPSPYANCRWRSEPLTSTPAIPSWSVPMDLANKHPERRLREAKPQSKDRPSLIATCLHTSQEPDPTKATISWPTICHNQADS